MAADAEAIEKKTAPGGTIGQTDRSFRGSWSGYERDFLFLNPDGPCPVFYNAAYLAGLDFDDDGRAAVPVDVDGDGDLDLVLLSLQRLSLLENTSPPRHFVRLRLTATKTQPAALGALVRVTAGGVTQQDYVRITDGFQSQVPLDLHFGLAEADRIDRIEITWPSKDVQVLESLPADRLHQIREGDPGVLSTLLSRWPDDARRRAKPEYSIALEAERLDGGRAPLASPGKPAVINFWAPWCEPCKRELPDLAALARARAADVQFAGVSAETKNAASVRDAVRTYALPYAQFLANDAVMKSFFGAGGEAILPSTFVFDAAGNLRRVFRRAVTAAELDALLDSFGDEAQDATSLAQHGRRLGQIGRYEESIEILQKAVAADPGHALAHYHLGISLSFAGKREAAIRYLRRSIDLDPGYWSAHFNLAAILHESGDFSGAVDHYNDALRLRGEDWNILLSLASSAAAGGKLPVAMDAFERAVKAAPKEPVAWAAKGQFHMILEQYPAARRCFEQALALDPAEPTAKAYMKDLEKIEGGGK
ncbi:MAG: tetratricopeptide repeat protein [Planctomycetes bacterium]|nr:tetratricopeptide repeat protein [Planctomycetota bacterium]